MRRHQSSVWMIVAAMGIGWMVIAGPSAMAQNNAGTGASASDELGEFGDRLFGTADRTGDSVVPTAQPNVPPGQGGTPPGQGGTPPGQGGGGPPITPPGQGGTPPGQGEPIIPEPASAALLGLGALALLRRRV